MAYYNSEIDEDGGMYHIKDKNKNSLEAMMTPKVISDKIFKPLFYTAGSPEKSYLDPEYNYIKTKADLVKAYENDPSVHTPNNNKPIDMFNFTAVAPDGSVYPLQTWIEDAYLKLYIEE